MQQPIGYPEEERPIDIYDLWNKFLRRRKLFFYIALPVFLGIVISQFTKPYTPIYKATFDLGVSQEKVVEGVFSQFQETGMQMSAVTQRVISNLLSVRLAEKIADSLRLFAYVKNGNSHIEVETRIKQDFKKPLGPFKLKISKDEFTLYKNGDVVARGGYNKFIDCGLFELKVIPRDIISRAKTLELTVYPRNKITLALRNSLAIKLLETDKIEKGIASSGVPFSGEGASKKLVSANPRVYNTEIGILRISILWGSPEDALRIARAFADQIIREDINEKSLQYIQSRQFIESQLSVYQEKLSELEVKVQKFKETKSITDLKASTQALISQVSQLESRKSQLEIERKILKDLEAYLTREGSEMDTTVNFAATLISDPVLQNFYSQLLAVEADLRGKLKEYSANHPKVLEVKAKLEGLKDQMKYEIAKRVPSIKTEIDGVQNQIATLQQKLKNVPEDEIQLARLERDRETAEKLYTYFAEKLEETKVQEAGVTSDLKIINPPLVSEKPVNSRGRLRALIIAMVLSLFVGGFAVFIAEYLDNSVKDPDIISDKLGLPIFASIPNIDEQDTKPKPRRVKRSGTMYYAQFLKDLLFSMLPKSVNNKNSGSSRRLTFIDPKVYSAEFEAFRKLSINLEFAHPEKKYQVIYITSTGPDEGKTLISLNLGVVLRLSNKKVLCLDTDFRKKRGSITDIVGMRKKPGLFDVLKAEIPLEKAIVQYKVKTSGSKTRSARTADSVESPEEKGSDPVHSVLNTLEVLPVGKIPPNPFVFLDSENMKSLISDLKSKYDYILIDGVPLILFADASYLANFADGVLLTARYGRTTFKELEYSRDMLFSSKSNIIGIIMNGVPKTREGYYYYHHYYYHKYYPKYYRTQ